MEANDKLKQEADSHNKTKKQNAELSVGAAGREHALVELQEKVAALQRARDALEAEAAALQAQVDQDLRAIGRAQCHRVQCALHADHLARTGCEQLRAGGIDGHPVAQHAVGEHRIGRLIQRGRPAVERTDEN